MTDIRIENSVALVTGANRGIGAAIARALLERGARKVYAGARRPETLAGLREEFGDRVVPLELDVTDGEEVKAAAAIATDVQILVNNAGVAGTPNVLLTDPRAGEFEREEFEVNVLGLLAVTRAFAPVLQANGGGAVVNLGSVASLVSFPMFQTYSASKAAVHSLTQALRIALPETRVVGVYPGPIDTAMAESIPFEKTSPAVVATEILDGIERGTEEVFPDTMSREMGAGFLADPKGLERQVQGMAAELVGA